MGYVDLLVFTIVYSASHICGFLTEKEFGVFGYIIVFSVVHIVIMCSWNALRTEQENKKYKVFFWLIAGLVLNLSISFATRHFFLVNGESLLYDDPIACIVWAIMLRAIFELFIQVPRGISSSITYKPKSTVNKDIEHYLLEDKNFLRLSASLKEWINNAPRKVNFEEILDPYDASFFVINEVDDTSLFKKPVNIEEKKIRYGSSSCIIHKIRSNTRVFILYWDNENDLKGDKEYYYTSIDIYVLGKEMDGFITHDLEEVLIEAGVVDITSPIDTHLQTLHLFLDAVSKGNIKKYYWGPFSLTRYKIAGKYIYHSKEFSTTYKPRWLGRRPTRIVSYEPWFSECNRP